MPGKRIEGTWFRYVLLAMPVLAITACMRSEPPPTKPQPPVLSQPAQAERYVQNIALTQLTLENASEPANIKPYLTVLNSYGTENKKIRTAVPLTVLSMEYTLEGQKKPQTVLVPVRVVEKPEFAALKETMKKLSVLPYTLQNMQVQAVTITPSKASKFPKEATAAVTPLIERQRQQLLAGAKALDPLDNVRLHMHLVRFFMAERSKDPAYFALENAKHGLAAVAEKSPEKAAEAQALSEEIVEIETSLHEEMPYKI